MSASSTDIIVKAALIGEYAVGKTTLFQRYIYDKLSYQPTIGVDFMPKHERIHDLNVTLHLWDTAGQERFRSIIRTYFRNIYLFILVFDVTRLDTFQSLTQWLKVISQETKCDYRIVLIANKADAPANEWQVTRLEVTRFAHQQSIDTRDVHFVSATSDNDPTVERMFRTTLMTLVEDLEYIKPFGGLIDRRLHQTTEKKGMWTNSYRYLRDMKSVHKRTLSETSSEGLHTPPNESDTDTQTNSVSLNTQSNEYTKGCCG